MATLCLVLLVIGGLNWGLVGLFTFDAVAWLCGGATTVAARIIYVLVAAAAVVGAFLLCPKKRD